MTEPAAAEKATADEEPAVVAEATADLEPEAAESAVADKATDAEGAPAKTPVAEEQAVTDEATAEKPTAAAPATVEKTEPTTPEKPEGSPADEAQSEPAAKKDAKTKAGSDAPAKAEAKPEPTPETPAEAKPEPTAEAEPAADPKPKAEPKATRKASPKTEAEAEAESKPEAAPKTEAAAKPEVEAEPKAEAEPAPKTEAKTEAEAKPEAAPKTEAKAEPEAKPAAAPKAGAKPASKAKSKAAPAAEAGQGTKSEKAPEPAAADGDTAPQGPPAPGDESGTGGAGGKKDTTEAAGEAEPALPLTALKKHAPGLTTAYKAAATALEKNDLTGTRAKVYLVLDRSASMRPYYKDGSAQALAEQTLALAAHLDPEATVPVVFFSTELDGTGEITLSEHENKIDDLHAGLGRMGRTSYHAAVEAVLAHHDKTAADPGTPALVVFQTDGAPDAKTPATQALTDAAESHPAVFFSFVAFGDPENKAFDYLRKLKTPNTSHFLAGETPRELTDKELYEGVLANWRP
ncbi:VWA domain-containing protein [Streptomyces sp. NPDC050698]